MPTETTETRAGARQAAIEEALKGMQGQLKELLGKVNGMENALLKQNEKIEIMEEILKENRELKSEINQIKSDNLCIKKRMDEMEDYIEGLQRVKNRSKIEIMGVPHTNEENLLEKVKMIANLAKIKIEAKEIKILFRLRPKGQKPGAIEVDFEEARLRDSFMKEVKKIRPKIEDIGEKGKGKIFINEKLTAKAKNVLYNVRQEAFKREWRNVWTYGGIVFIKKTEAENPIKVRSLGDLEELIK